MKMWRWWCSPEQHFLRWAVGLSLLFHIALLSWAPLADTQPAPKPETLEMVIVTVQTEAAPIDPKRLAQNNLEGGGLAQDGVASNPTPQVGQSDEAIAIEAMTQQRAALESQQNELLEQLLKEWVVPASIPLANQPDDTPTVGVDPIDQASLERNAEIAALVDRIERYNAMPKRFYDAPSAQAHPYVEYIDQWRQKIEETGRRFYPGEGNNRPTGSLQATITIDSNGQIVDIALDRPSPLAILNQAVRRIVQLAGPFPPFPPNMRQNIDQLVITRTWQFKAGQLNTTTTPNAP
jgi:protein TonB